MYELRKVYNFGKSQTPVINKSLNMLDSVHFVLLGIMSSAVILGSMNIFRNNIPASHDMILEPTVPNCIFFLSSVFSPS